MAKQFDTDKIFSYHPPFGSQPARYEALRASAKNHADLILMLTPPSREQALALTDLQRSTQMANAAIAITEAPEAVVSTEPQPNTGSANV